MTERRNDYGRVAVIVPFFYKNNELDKTFVFEDDWFYDKIIIGLSEF